MLLVLPACDPTLMPDPPKTVSGHAEAFSIGYGNILVVTEGGGVRPGGLLSITSTIPAPKIDNDGDGEADLLKLLAIVDVAAGQRHACVLSTTGTVPCWGDQTNGALGPYRPCDLPPAEGGVPNCVLGPDRAGAAAGARPRRRRRRYVRDDPRGRRRVLLG